MQTVREISKLVMFGARHCALWDVTIAGPTRCPGWCQLVTVSVDPFTSTTGPFLSEWAKCLPRNTQNGRTVLQIVNLIADSETGSPGSYSCFVVTKLSHFVPEILSMQQMDRQ